MKIALTLTLIKDYLHKQIPVILLIIMFNIVVYVPLNGSAISLQNRVTGTVTDASGGEPMPGVNIKIKDSSLGVITDMNGKFTISIADPDAVLVFSFIGYVTQEVAISGRTTLNVALISDLKGLEEVVVIGYGTQKKVNLSGAVDVVTSKSIENRPVANVVQALQGAAPNVNISVGNSGGEMGAKLSLNIRGQGSISGGSVYTLVDGIEQDISNLNPDDIESVSVLKDAAASAIYGARAAFGVILVTTKKGKSGGISVNYNNNFSFAAPTVVPHSMNSMDFAEYFNVGSVNDGKPALFEQIIVDNIKRYNDGDIDYWTVPVPWAPVYWLTYSGAWANTDWYKEHYKNWTPNSTHNFSISGGDDRTQFYVSGSAFDQSGLMKIGDDSFNRNNLSTKLNTKIMDWLRFSLTSKFNRSIIGRPSYDRSQYYNSLARQWPTNAPYFPDGNLSYDNVQIWLEQGGRYNEMQNELSVIPGFEIEPVKGLIVYANYRWKMNTAGITNHDAKVIATGADGSKIFIRPTNSFASANSEGYYNSPNLYSTYNFKLGENNFSFLAGFEQELIKYDTTMARRYDLVSDEVPSLSTATGKQEAAGAIGHYSTRSFFGRFNYNYMEKYLLEASIRHDGSSKFPDNFRWGTFPSGSVAYVISKEDFWGPMSRYLDLLKLRLSYGALGNQDVANYLYIERLPVMTNLPYIMGDLRPNYVGMAGLMSPGLTWEKVNTTNFGLDAGMLGNKLTLSFDYFIRNTFDMLGPAESLPAVLGTDVPQSNNATLQTKGFELVLGWRDEISDFNYDIKFMVSDARTTIEKYYNPKKLLSSAFYEGSELGDMWGYTTVGLFKSDEEALAANQSYLSAEPWRAGDVQYADLDGDGKIDIGSNTVDDPGDLSIIGNSSPRYSYSAIFNANWKGLDFNMLWQGIAKRDLSLGGPLFWGAAGVPDGQWFSIGLQEHMDYWTPENTDAYWPRPYLDKGVKNHQKQTRYLQSGAYLRLKSVQVGYTLPSALTQKVHVKNLRVYVSGENLLTFTKLITVFDPEATGGHSGSGQIYPLQKLVSTGISVTF